MKLEFQMSGYDATGTARVTAAVLPLVEKIAKECGITDQHLNRLIVADEINYGTVIENLAAGERHTNSNELIGVGQTLPFVNQEGEICNHIVVRAEVINALLEQTHSGVLPNDWKPEHQLAAYVLPHEFGHCFDNINRPQSANEEKNLGKIFKIKRLADYYGNIGAREYAACFFSAHSVSAELLQYQFSCDAKTTRALMTDAHNRRLAYTGPHELFDLACAAASAAWLSMIQAAKIFGWRLGNKPLQSEALDWKQWFDSDINDLMTTLETSVAAEWQKYPNDLTGFQSALVDAWWNLTFAEGFKFEEDQEGDGVFFDTW